MGCAFSRKLKPRRGPYHLRGAECARDRVGASLLYLKNQIGSEGPPDAEDPQRHSSTDLILLGVGQVWMAEAGHF
jgi:hypothetical protein